MGCIRRLSTPTRAARRSPRGPISVPPRRAPMPLGRRCSVATEQISDAPPLRLPLVHSASSSTGRARRSVCSRASPTVTFDAPSPKHSAPIRCPSPLDVRRRQSARRPARARCRPAIVFEGCFDPPRRSPEPFHVRPGAPTARPPARSRRCATNKTTDSVRRFPTRRLRRLLDAHPDAHLGAPADDLPGTIAGVADDSSCSFAVGSMVVAAAPDVSDSSRQIVTLRPPSMRRRRRGRPRETRPRVGSMASLQRFDPASSKTRAE